MTRTLLRLALWLPLLSLCRVAAADGPSAGALGLEVDSVAITVSDMERALSFYTNVLDFEVVSDVERVGEAEEAFYGVFGARVRTARLRLGAESIELIEFLAPQGRPIPVDSRSNDAWFQHIAIVVSDMDRAYARLRAQRVRYASTEPQRLPDWNPQAGGIEAFYFRDPDGNHLEILEFPQGKGQPRWQSGASLFLGIDHTAIVVADTEASLGFYRDTLGFVVLGESENYGPEQERLNNVFGARLRITALGTGNGIGVELLEYLAPRTGRPMPPDTQANDLWHWQIDIETPGLAGIDEAIREARYRYVSPGIVRLPADARSAAAGTAATDAATADTVARGSRATGSVAALHVRDPDGHAVALRETLR